MIMVSLTLIGKLLGIWQIDFWKISTKFEYDHDILNLDDFEIKHRIFKKCLYFSALSNSYILYRSLSDVVGRKYHKDLEYIQLYSVLLWRHEL